MRFRRTFLATLAMLIALPPAFAQQAASQTSAATGAASTSETTVQAQPAQTNTSTNSIDSAQANTAAAAANSAATTTGEAPKPLQKTPKVSNKWKAGQELEITTNTEDLVPTDDVELARKQVEKYPDSPEASFILAVALTRTSHVEDALKEVRRARKLAEKEGGTAYFDKMITTYEEMLKNYPNENRVKYGLAWAYYMKAYLVANYSRKVAAWKAVNGDPNEVLKKQAAAAAAGQPLPQAPVAVAQNTATSAGNKDLKAAFSGISSDGKVDMAKVAMALTAVAQGNNPPADVIPKIPSIFDKTDPNDVPQIKKYFELALQKLDDLIAQKPDDVWALVYRAHLRAEYSGDLEQAMKTWAACRDKFPNNPAPYFFLGEGYLKQGNLKESINNVSRAVALRALGF